MKYLILLFIIFFPKVSAAAVYDHELEGAAGGGGAVPKTHDEESAEKDLKSQEIQSLKEQAEAIFEYYATIERINNSYSEDSPENYMAFIELMFGSDSNSYKVSKKKEGREFLNEKIGIYADLYKEDASHLRDKILPMDLITISGPKKETGRAGFILNAAFYTNYVNGDARANAGIPLEFKELGNLFIDPLYRLHLKLFNFGYKQCCVGKEKEFFSAFNYKVSRPILRRLLDKKELSKTELGKIEVGIKVDGQIVRLMLGPARLTFKKTDPENLTIERREDHLFIDRTLFFGLKDLGLLKSIEHYIYDTIVEKAKPAAPATTKEERIKSLMDLLEISRDEAEKQVDKQDRNKKGKSKKPKKKKSKIKKSAGQESEVREKKPRTKKIDLPQSMAPTSMRPLEMAKKVWGSLRYLKFLGLKCLLKKWKILYGRQYAR